jgi:hypothetical protein
LFHGEFSIGWGLPHHYLLGGLKPTYYLPDHYLLYHFFEGTARLPIADWQLPIENRKSKIIYLGCLRSLAQ